MAASSSPDVVVIGAGAVGVCTAYELASAGAHVTLIERNAGVGQACSFGNAGMLRTDHLAPLATPSAVLQGLRSIFDPSGSFALRLRPALIPWLARFVLAARPGQVQKNQAVLRALGRLSRSVHDDYVDSGIDTGVQRSGVLDFFESPANLAAARREAAHDSSAGTNHQVLSPDEVKRVLPALKIDVAGCILYPNEWFCDPLKFTAAVGDAAVRRGASIQTGAEVRAIHTRNGHVVGVETSGGEIACGAVVLAAGVWSTGLAKPLGVALPVESGKGYHIEFARTRDDPELPFIMHEAHVSVSPLPGGLRFGGTLELSGIDENISERRVGAIRATADRLFGQSDRAKVTRVWTGMRPCSPDGLPMLGRTQKFANLYVATGHGMQGVVLAAGSGRALAELITGREPSFTLEPMTPNRF